MIDEDERVGLSDAPGAELALEHFLRVAPGAFRFGAAATTALGALWSVRGRGAVAQARRLVAQLGFGAGVAVPGVLWLSA